MPGASFKRKAKVWRKAVDQMVELPFKVTKDLMVRKRL